MNQYDFLDLNSANVQETLFKCDICTLTFRTPSERNEHILNHLQKTACSVCNQTLIQLGNTWYSPHEHTNHTLIKNETDFLEETECLTISTDHTNSDRIDTNEQESKHEFDINDEEVDNRETFGPEFITIPHHIKQEPANILISEEVHNQCNICSKVFSTSSNLSRHKKNHFITSSATKSNETQSSCESVKNTWQCVACKKSFSSKNNLIQHQNTSCDNSKHNQDRYKATNNKVQAKSIKSCHICNKEFISKDTFEHHLNMHSGQRPYQCTMCDKTWTNRRSLREHERRHLEYSANTKIQPSNNVSDVNDDIDMNEMDEPTTQAPVKKVKKQMFTCDICKKDFSGKTALKDHINLHLGLRQFECSECGKSFIHQRKLNKHKKTHGIFKNSDVNNMNDVEISAVANDEHINITPNQLYNSSSCPICGKLFEDNLRVKKHLKVHKELRFTCKICQQEFISMNHCQSHISSIHANREGVNFRSYEDTLQLYKKSQDLIDWVCEYCIKVFEFEINLAKHILKDHSEDKSEHQCNICGSQFSRLDDLLTHMRAHPETIQHECDFDGCGQTFAFKSLYLTHFSKHKQNNRPIIRRTQDDLSEFSRQQAMLSLNGKCADNSLVEKALTCTFCSKVFPNQTTLRQHEYVHMNPNERIKCTVTECDKIYKSHIALRQHIKKDHPDAMKKCKICSKHFYSDGEFDKHQLKHDQPATMACSICSETFTMKHALRLHLSRHEKEVSCNICNEKFATVNTMVEHRKRHGKKTVITCQFPDCNQTFENRRALMLHSMQHPEEQKKRCICTICGKKLSTSGLKGHMNSHTGSRPFICKVCGKSFMKDGSLRRHNMIHTGEKPYVCDIGECHQAYRDSIDLKRHKFSIHKIYTKKHTCSICSKVFSENKLLTKHINSVHGCNNLE